MNKITGMSMAALLAAGTVSASGADLSGVGQPPPPGNQAPAAGTPPADGSGPAKARRSPYPVRSGAYLDDYAALNAMREGVVVLPSGLQYEVLASGSGRRPQADSTVAVNYRGTLANGVEFDSTYRKGNGPAVLRIDRLVVPGLREALLLMREGDKWRVTIPAPLGYSGGRLLRKRDLIYEIVLVSVRTPASGGPAESAQSPQSVPTGG